MPDDKIVPDVDAAYQSIVSPAPGVAEIITVPVKHLAPLTATGAAGNGATVITAVPLCN